MKKLVALTLASLMLLAGCSSTPKNDGNEATPTPEAAATEADEREGKLSGFSGADSNRGKAV